MGVFRSPVRVYSRAMRKILSLLVGAALLLSTYVTAQTAPAARVITMATLAPAGSPWMQVFEAANRELRRRTNNALSIRWYGGGVQGDEPEVIRKIRSGRLDGAAVTAVGLGQIHRPILAFQIPGIFADDTHLVRARDAVQADLMAAFQAQGFVLLGFGSAGAPRLMSTHAIRVPHDLVSSHPWVWPADLILPAIYAEVGCQGVPRDVPQVLAALQTNQIDTIIASPLAAVSFPVGERDALHERSAQRPFARRGDHLDDRVQLPPSGSAAGAARGAAAVCSASRTARKQR